MGFHGRHQSGFAMTIACILLALIFSANGAASNVFATRESRAIGIICNATIFVPAFAVMDYATHAAGKARVWILERNRKRK